MALISPTYNNIEQNNDEKLKNIKHVTVDFLAKYVRVLMIEIPYKNIRFYWISCFGRLHTVVVRHRF